MENLFGAIILVSVVAIVVQDRPDMRDDYVRFVQVTQASAKAGRDVRRTVRGQVRTERDVRPATIGTTQVALINQVNVAFDVPAGCLYGVCKKESGCLASGWSPGWMLATEARDGQCQAHGKSAAWCQEQWNALVEVCEQRRNDGSAVCNPSEVRTSWAFAMGMFQQLPTTVLRLAKADPNVDFDRDGAVDPHSFADGAAMAGRFLSNEFAKRNPKTGWNAAWMQAANAYFGSQESGYYSGKWVTRTDRKTGKSKRMYAKGVGDHWRDWCKTHRCEVVYASK